MSGTNFNETTEMALTDANVINAKAYSGTTQGIGNGTFYFAGFYFAPAADANLTQASATVSLGTANSAYGAHVFLVAGAVGTASGGAGAVEIEVSGTSIADDGTRVAADTEVIVADITTLSTDDFLETTKKWIGQVVFTLQNAGGSSQTTFAVDFNYGFSNYDDFGNRNFTITDFEAEWDGGANDSGFDIELLHHEITGWTYSAAAFIAGSTPIVQLTTDYNTEVDLVTSEPGAYKRTGLSEAIAGATGEGVIIRMTTTVNNSVEFIYYQIKATLP